MAKRKTYDAIVIGAGSVGLPSAYFLTLEDWKVLVLDSDSSPGQGKLPEHLVSVNPKWGLALSPSIVGNSKNGVPAPGDPVLIANRTNVRGYFSTTIL